MNNEKLSLSVASVVLGLVLVERGTCELRKTDWKRCFHVIFAPR